MHFHRLLLTLAAVSLAACVRPSDKPPDVVVVVMDTTRADRLGVYGNPRPVSPHLDAFAREALLFRHAWSTSSWTLPAHASLLTGLYPSAHGARITPHTDQDSLGDNPPRLSSEAETLAERLAARGYHTAAFVAAGWLAPEFGLLQGYAVHDAENLRARPANEITDLAIAWLASVPEDEPLHLLLNYFDPHDPAPPEGFGGFPGEEIPLEPPTMHPERGVVISPQQRAARLARYDGAIRFTDFHVHRLLEALRAAGRFEDALIIVTADHGEHFGEHGAMGHGAWLYEEVLRIPLLVRLPGGREAGRQLETPVSLVDVVPLVERELTRDPRADGDGPLLEARELIYAEETPNALLQKFYGGTLDRNLRAGIRWPFKLIVASDGTRELYRLDGDPREARPLDEVGIAEEILREVERVTASLEPLPGETDPKPMSPELEARLRELGYLE